MPKGVRWSESDLKAFAARGQRAQAAVDAVLPKAVKKDGLWVAGGRTESKLEIRFDQQLVVDGLPAPIKNYLFLKDRDLEIDRAWPQWKVGVEIQGGAHRASKANLDRDCEKLCLGLLAGWWILPIGDALVRSGRGLELLLAVVALRKSRGKRATDA